MTSGSSSTRRKSALPKDQAAGETYRVLARALVQDPPPLLRELIDLDAVAAWLPAAQPLDERRRAALFRLIGLANWAQHHQVAL